MTDYTLEDTIYFLFTTRQFSTGAPFLLAGTPVVSAYEDNSTTQITAGVTLGVSHDSVTGLNLITVAATTANGFESGKDYHLVITTGTVDSVSVVGEVVGRFTLGRSAAAVDLANGTDGLTAIKADTAAILVDTAEIGAAGAGLTAINLPDQTMNITGNITGNLSGSVGSVATGGITAASIANGAIDAATFAADVDAEILSYLVDDATRIDASALNTAAVTSIPAILVDTGTTLDTLIKDIPTSSELATALAAADDAVLAAIAALENLSAAEVNTQVLDVLNTDTFAEPGQGAPAATASLVAKIGYLYKAWRNKHTVTSSEYALYADDGTTKDQEATVADDATTFTRGEIATGA